MSELSPVIKAALANHEPHPEHKWLLKSKDVAAGYGCSTDSLRQAKKQHADELLEGSHWVKDGRLTLWTQRGVIRLGNFIKSKQAAEFRSAAETFLCSAINGELRPSTLAVSPLAIAPQRQAQLDQVVTVALQAKQVQQQQADQQYLREQFEARLGEVQAQPLEELGQWLAGIQGFELAQDVVNQIANLSADTGAMCENSAT